MLTALHNTRKQKMIFFFILYIYYYYPTQSWRRRVNNILGLSTSSNVDKTIEDFSVFLYL